MIHFFLSGKTAFLFATLPVFVESGERVVVASGSTAVLDIVQRLCRVLKLTHARIDGKTHPDKRKKAAQAFAPGTGSTSSTDGNSASAEAPPNVLLLSARAGGAGLNLQGASVMILTECDWNPATDEQVSARIWRTGQGRKTRIYRLVSAGTLEETILARQSAKLSLWRAAGVGGDSAAPIARMSLERSLFAKTRHFEAFDEDGKADGTKENNEQNYEQNNEQNKKNNAQKKKKKKKKKKKRRRRTEEDTSDWRWYNAGPGAVKEQVDGYGNTITSSQFTCTKTPNQEASMVEEEVVDDNEDHDPFLPFVARDVVIGSLLRKTEELDGWEEKADLAVAKAKTNLKPKRKKRKKTALPMDGNVVAVKDNRPRWMQMRYPRKTKKGSGSGTSKSTTKVFTY